MKIKHAILVCTILPSFFLNCKDDKKEMEATPQTVKTSETNETEDQVNRGKYLVAIMGCTDCHTPKNFTERGPVPDEKRFLMGHPSDEAIPAINKDEIAPGKWVQFSSGFTAAAGPWGVSFAANLTPDETGLGNWTVENFKTALKHGKFKGMENQRMLLPPMPWENFAHLTDSDLESMYAYLKTIKPIKNIVPNAIPPTEM